MSDEPKGKADIFECSCTAADQRFLKEKDILKRQFELIGSFLLHPLAAGERFSPELFEENRQKAVTMVRMAYAQQSGFDTVMIDTAGRLHIDEALMKELQDIEQLVQADEILLTVDAMTGQDIVNVAKAFHEALPITGLVVTKFDGDSRGGGVLSVKAITQVPVKFVGEGEKIEDMDVFHPDRMN